MAAAAGPSGSTRVAAVIGHPVRHSLSPAIHNAAFAAAGADWVYVAWDVAPGRAADALAAVRALGIGGLSVTMPHKEEAAAAVDELDPAASALRSVNTVVPMGDGRLRGHSTDGAGFVASLAAAGVAVAGQAVAVVGSGAAARAVVDALARAGAAEVVVTARSAERAAAAAALGGGRARIGTAADVPGCGIVVNATPVGMAGGPDAASVAVDAALLRPEHVVADLVYHPLDTPLLQAAAAAGARCVDGLGMLVHQAALQQELWLGALPDVDVMLAAARAELGRRGR